MDRSERIGIGAAVFLHAALLAGLSLAFLSRPQPIELKSQPIEVALTDQVALESMSPVPNADVPAARLSPVEAPVEPESAPQPEPQPEPEPRPEPPRPAPRPEPQPHREQPRPATRPDAQQRREQPRPDSRRQAQPTQQRPRDTQRSAPQPQATRSAQTTTRRPTGRLDGLVGGLSDRRSDSRSTVPPAANAGPRVEAALVAEIRRQLKPHWIAPTGADVDQLVTVLRVRLNRDGTLAGRPELVEQRGITPSNRAQAPLHLERAIRAVELAAPFNLPAQYYDAWRIITPSFDRRLSL